MPERALQIAQACIEDIETNGFYRKDFHVNMEPTSFLENIFYFRVCSYTEQIALINYLDKFISDHQDVGTMRIIMIVMSSGHSKQVP